MMHCLVGSEMCIRDRNKHTVLIQKDAGIGAGFLNSDYELSGAKIVNSAEDIFNDSEMIVKVKEPVPEEYKFLRNDLTLFAYLHLAGDPENAKKLIDTGVTGIAYETVTSEAVSYTHLTLPTTLPV